MRFVIVLSIGIGSCLVRGARRVRIVFIVLVCLDGFGVVILVVVRCVGTRLITAEERGGYLGLDSVRQYGGVSVQERVVPSAYVAFEWL